MMQQQQLLLREPFKMLKSYPKFNANSYKFKILKCLYILTADKNETVRYTIFLSKYDLGAIYKGMPLFQ